MARRPVHMKKTALPPLKRAALKASDFAVPSERKYPINDLFHARLALTYVLTPSNAAYRDEVVRAVLARYPELQFWWASRSKGVEAKRTTRKAMIRRMPGQRMVAKPRRRTALEGTTMLHSLWKEIGTLGGDDEGEGSFTWSSMREFYPSPIGQMWVNGLEVYREKDALRSIESSLLRFGRVIVITSENIGRLVVDIRMDASSFGKGPYEEGYDEGEVKRERRAFERMAGGVRTNPRLKAMIRRMPGQRMVANPRRRNPAADPTPMQRWSKKGVTVGLFDDFSGVLTVATKTGDEDYVPVFRTKSYPAAVKYAEQYMSEVKTNPRRRNGADPFAAVRRATKKEVARYADAGGSLPTFAMQRLMDAAYRVYNTHLTMTGEQLPIEEVHAEIVEARTQAQDLRREHNREEAHQAKDAYREEQRQRVPSLYGSRKNPRRKAGASPTDVGALEARAIARGKREILEDIKSGRVPSAVRTFAELHDYVDANEYGGLTDSPNLFGGVSRHAELSAMSRVQDALDAWLRTGRRAGAKHKVVASNPRPAKRSRYEGLDTAIMVAASSIAGNVADTRDHATVWSSPLEAVNMSEGTAELLWREGEFGSSTGYPFEKAWPSIKRDALGMTKSIWSDVKHNPRHAKRGSSRSGRTAAQSNAAKAMNLFHSGQASSLAEAWAMLRRR